MEIICNFLQKSRAPLSPEGCGAIWEACKDMGVLLGKGGLYGNVRFPSCTGRFCMGLVERGLFGGVLCTVDHHIG